MHTIISTFTVIHMTQDEQLKQCQKEIKKGFEKEDGPFVKCLDTALSSFNVQRQAYYGGTFVGNHVHRCLKV